VSTLQGALRCQAPQLVRLHCVSRRAPVALADGGRHWRGLALLLRAHGTPTAHCKLPLVFETAASAVISIATTGPFASPNALPPLAPATPSQG